MKSESESLRKSAGTYATWGTWIIIVGLIGAALMAFGAYQPETCNPFAENLCEPDRLLQFAVFVGLAFTAVLPSLPLFALSRVLDGVSDVLRAVQDHEFAERRRQNAEAPRLQPGEAETGREQS